MGEVAAYRLHERDEGEIILEPDLHDAVDLDDWNTQQSVDGE